MPQSPKIKHAVVLYIAEDGVKFNIATLTTLSSLPAHWKR
jgi:hypothetical protein